MQNGASRSRILEATQPQPRFDCIEILQAFGYEVAFDPGNGVVHIFVDMPLSKKRYDLPFDRISFAAFVKALSGVVEGLEKRMSDVADSN